MTYNGSDVSKRRNLYCFISLGPGLEVGVRSTESQGRRRDGAEEQETGQRGSHVEGCMEIDKI